MAVGSSKSKKAVSKRSPDSTAIEIFRGHNPYWSSSLFNEVYLRNEVPRKYADLWHTHEGFEKFHQQFHNFVIETQGENFESWNEAATIKNWIVHVMDLLGWHDKCESVRVNPYISELPLTIHEDGRKKTYRADLVYVDEPGHKKHIESEEGAEDRLREARSELTGAKIVVEAKYWDKLEHARQNRNEDKKRAKKEQDEGTRHLDPNDQTLKYMEILQLNFGILTDGKTWRLFHREMSKGDVRRYFEFDLGNLASLVRRGIDNEKSRELFLQEARYFYFFFRKASLVQEEASAPFVYKVLDYSRTYASEVREDLKERFIEAMGYACNALKKSFEASRERVDLDTIRNVCESHIFNILFIRSCESRKILPLGPPAYHKISLTEVVESLDHMYFDPEKGLDTFMRYFKSAFGPDFSLRGTEIYDRLMKLYQVVQDGDMGFEITGFKESVFSKDEWAIAKKHKIPNEAMFRVLFSLNFTESEFKSGSRKYQQIPYNIFTPRQLGSIYESFLEFRLEEAEHYMIFAGKQWKTATRGSAKAESLVKRGAPEVAVGDLYFTPDNKDRKMSGSFYTPDTLVEHIIQETLAPMCHGASSRDLMSLAVCDPAMGSGHFLSAALRFMTEKYRELVSEETLSDVTEQFEESARQVLDSCIFGADINARAVKLAKMSLWLATALINRKLERLDDQLKCIDSLNVVSWTEAFCRNGREIQFDCMLGNPPFGASVFGHDEDQVEARSRALHSEFAKQFSDLPISDFSKVNSFALFILSGWRCLKPSGVLSFVISDTFRSILSFQRIRQWLMEKRILLSYDVAPDDSFSPLIVYTGIISLGGSSRKSESVRCRDLSALALDDLPSTFLKNLPVAEHTSSDLLRISGTPIPFLIENCVKVMMMDRPDEKTLGIGEQPAVGSYAGIQTGNDKMYLAVLEGADLTGVTIKTGIGNLQVIKENQICRREITEKERENGISMNGPFFVPFVKAMRSERYFYVSPLYINWSTASVKTMKTWKNPKGQVASVFRNKEIYFKPGLVSSGENGVLSTFFVESSIPAVSTNLIQSNTEGVSTKYLCGLLNSSLMSYVLSNVINSALKGMSSHVTPNDINRLPFEKPSDMHHKRVEKLVDEMLRLKEEEGTKAAMDKVQVAINKVVFDVYSVPEAARGIIERWFFARMAVCGHARTRATKIVGDGVTAEFEVS